MNQGEIRGMDKSLLTLNGKIDNTGGTIVLDDGATLTLGSNGNTQLSGGTLTAGTDRGARLNTSSTNTFLGDFRISGHLDATTSTPTLFGRLTNDGLVRARSLAISKVVTFAGNGEIVFMGAGTVSSGGDPIPQVPARIINTENHTLKGSVAFTVPMVNEGCLAPETMTFSRLTMGPTSQVTIAPTGPNTLGSLVGSTTSVFDLAGDLTIDFTGLIPAGMQTIDIVRANLISGDFSSFTVRAPSLPWVGAVTYSILPDAVGNGTDVVRLTINNGVSGLLGDFNNDGNVNAADYTMWRDLRGTREQMPNDPTPGVIDSADYATWSANFGRTVLPVAMAVPEPRALLLMLLLLACRSCFQPWFIR